MENVNVWWIYTKGVQIFIVLFLKILCCFNFFEKIGQKQKIIQALETYEFMNNICTMCFVIIDYPMCCFLKTILTQWHVFTFYKKVKEDIIDGKNCAIIIGVTN